MRANAAIMIDRGRTVDDGVLANEARAEVDLLIGDFVKARTNLAWKPKTNPSLASMMTGADYDRVKSDRVFF